MTQSSLFSILFCCLLALTVVSGNSYSQSEDTITEAKVLAMVNSVDRAARKGNVTAILGTLANDVKIKMRVSIPSSDKEQVVNLNKEQYALHTRRAFRRRLAYQLERKNTRVKIYNEGKTAMVTGDLYESLTIQQGTIRAVSSEVAILSLREGKILVTSLEDRKSTRLNSSHESTSKIWRMWS